MQYDVAFVPCGDYELSTCRRALEQVLEPLGGLYFVTPGIRVAIKANLVSAMKPEAAATTHPALLCALTQLLKERGASVVIGDSPGGLYTSAYVGMVYNAAGLRRCEEFGAELNHDFGQSLAQFPQAEAAKTFQYTSYLDSADVIIDFCKLKTHGMMGMSNAAKNLFGVIPGTMKPEYHFKYPTAESFAQMLVDLNEYFCPQLSITDAVIGMEGNGPTMGTPRKIGLLGASLSTHKLDLACARLLGLGREDVPTLQAAYVRGLIPATADELAVFGDLTAMAVPDFKNIQAQHGILFQGKEGSLSGRLRSSFLRVTMRARPAVQAGACVGCGKCASICPAKAIIMKNKLPKINRRTCIHCFCCQEFCPKGAMRVSRPLVARLLNR